MLTWCPRLAVAAFLAAVLWGCAEDGSLMGGCGNGRLDPLEQCDDGGNVDGDGCSADCMLEGGGAIPATLAAIQENVFGPYCTACHFPGGTGPMPLDTQENSYNSLVVFPFSFTCAVRRVDPGNPDGSCLIMKLEDSPLASGNPMPPPGWPQMNEQFIGTIRDWIEQGADP